METLHFDLCLNGRNFELEPLSVQTRADSIRNFGPIFTNNSKPNRLQQIGPAASTSFGGKIPATEKLVFV